MHSNIKIKFVFYVAFLSLFGNTKALELDYTDEDEFEDGRQLFPIVIGTGGTVTFNLTQLATIGALLASALLSALALGALGFLLFSLFEHKYYDSGSGSGGYGGDSGGGYSSYSSYRRSFNYDGVNWEQFTILDFIAIAEEAYQKFNPSDLECQKRLICEIHQNTAKFGFAAQRMVDMFSYLQYIEVLSLPDEFKALAEEYLDAADRGRNMSKDCGEVYDTCKFSVKKLTDKFSHNEI